MRLPHRLLVRRENAFELGQRDRAFVPKSDGLLEQVGHARPIVNRNGARGRLANAVTIPIERSNQNTAMLLKQYEKQAGLVPRRCDAMLCIQPERLLLAARLLLLILRLRHRMRIHHVVNRFLRPEEGINRL